MTEMYSYHPAGGVTIKHLHIYKPWYNSTENISVTAGAMWKRTIATARRGR